MILGLHHVALSVPDIDEAREFYCGKLGFEAVMEAALPSGLDFMAEALGIGDSQYKVAMLGKGNSFIELFEFQAEDTPIGDPSRPVNQHGITHFCLVTDDYDADHAMFEAAGIVFNSAPNGPAPNRWAYCRDPFGNVIELQEHNPDIVTARNFSG